MIEAEQPAASTDRMISGGDGASPRVVGFLARLAIDFTTVLNLPDLLTHVMKSLHDELGFESASIALADDASHQAFVIRAASGLRESHIGDIVPAGRGLHGAVARTAMPLFIPDMDADPRAFLRDPKMKAGIYAPLIVRGGVIGVVSAHRSRANAFTESDLDLLTIVARYLAGAIEVARLHEQLKAVATTDMLTGLANRRGFFDRLNAEVSRAQRAGDALSIALLDLNLLKAINDRYGHHIGDCALVILAQTLSRTIRASDLAARVGGDEFTLLLPGLTVGQAGGVLDRIAQTEMRVPDARGGSVLLKFAWGAAGWPDDGNTPDALLGVADLRLYAMKASRRPDEETVHPEPTA